MMLLRALGSGLAGACALTLLNESARRFIPGAPRMEVIGMRAIAKSLRKIEQTPPPKDELFAASLVGDIVSNSLYYSLAAADDSKQAWLRGSVLGLAAGIGAAFLPPRIGLGRQPGERPPATQIMTVAWYLAGGLAAAAAASFLNGTSES